MTYTTETCVESLRFQPKTKEELQKAVDEWCEDRATAKKKYNHINTWDVRQVTDMSYLFADKCEFNDPIGEWDTSNVTNMEGMFYDANAFNQSIGGWNIRNVTNMICIFQYAVSMEEIPSWSRFS